MSIVLKIWRIASSAVQMHWTAGILQAVRSVLVLVLVLVLLLLVLLAGGALVVLW
jgi:hypothetical protein